MHDVWSWPGWTALGVLFGALATIAAFLAWRQGKRSQQIADARYKIADDRYARDIVPRPRLVGLRPGTPTTEWIAEILNAGGLASNSCSWFKKRASCLLAAQRCPAMGPRTCG